jgi:AraC-like DNA-binding protein
MQLHVPVRALQEIVDGGRTGGQPIVLKDPLFASDPGVMPLVHAMTSALARQDRLAPAYIDGLAIALLTRLVSRFAASGWDERRAAISLDGRLQRSIDFINAHLADDLRLASMSSVAGLSPYHFSHLFTAAIGMPPHRYLLKLRIERARERLRFSRDSILAVALDCGFKDASHFARVFARETGLSPRQFRQAD